MENKHFMEDLPSISYEPYTTVLGDDESLQLQVVRVQTSLLMGIGAGSQGCYQRWSKKQIHAPSPTLP